MSEPDADFGTDSPQDWLFRCPECGKEWNDPPAPVSTCYDGHEETEVDVFPPGEVA